MDELFHFSFSASLNGCLNSLSSMRTTDNSKLDSKRKLIPSLSLCPHRQSRSRLGKSYRGGQRGTVFFSVRLAVDCYDDTHYGSGTESKVAERLLMANRVYAALQGFRPNNSMTALVRTKSRFYSLPAGVKAYEYTFSFRIHDDSARELQRGE